MTQQIAQSQDVLNTPIGALLINASAQGVTRIKFLDENSTHNLPTSASHKPGDPHQQMLERVIAELDAYFHSELSDFSLPIDAAGSEFQCTVWMLMRSIPMGETLSYGELAQRAGSPGAARAVGAACAINPVPILTPCHRVVAADGSLHGFAGGLWRKEWLLNHEGARPLALC